MSWRRFEILQARFLPSLKKIAPALTILVLLGIVALVTKHTSLGPQPFSLVGEPVPALKVQQLEGQSVSLTDLTGKARWVLINFWTTSCSECRDEMESLRRFADWSKSQGTQGPLLININVQDSDTDVIDYVANFQTPSPILRDIEGQVARRFGVTGVPEMFFVDPTGFVRHHETGILNFEGMVRTLETLQRTRTTTGNTPSQKPIN